MPQRCADGLRASGDRIKSFLAKVATLDVLKKENRSFVARKRFPEQFAIFVRIQYEELEQRTNMSRLLSELRKSRLLWLLVFVPVVLAGERLWPERHTLLFLLSVLAIVPLAALLSRATESVAERTGDAVGGLLNATLGNLTELVIALTALQAGQYLLVKASIAGAIVTNTLFMLGGSFLIGGLRHHEQQFNRVSARSSRACSFSPPWACSCLRSSPRRTAGKPLTQPLSLGLAVLLIIAYGLSMLFSLRTHKEAFASVGHGEAGETPWPIGVALVTFSRGDAARRARQRRLRVVGAASGRNPRDVACLRRLRRRRPGRRRRRDDDRLLRGRQDRLDLSVGIALGSAAQIALFVAPLLVLLSYVIGPAPMSLQFWPGAIVMMLIATMTATLMTNGGRSAWFVGGMILMVYAIFALTLFLLPPAA